jgi:hypothetical protein
VDTVTLCALCFALANVRALANCATLAVVDLKACIWLWLGAFRHCFYAVAKRLDVILQVLRGALPATFLSTSVPLVLATFDLARAFDCAPTLFPSKAFITVLRDDEMLIIFVSLEPVVTFLHTFWPF